MAHWAEIDENNIVLRVTVGSNDDSDEGYQWLIDNLGGTWVQTSYNTHGGINSREGGEAFRKNYAGIGYLFDGVGFYSPSPYPSWTKDAQTYLWQAPTPMPREHGKIYAWNETTSSWDVVVSTKE